MRFTKLFKNDEIQEALIQLGARVRTARIARGDGQDAFAKRLGVSVPTLRSLEKGEPTVAMGTFMAALWALSRLSDVALVLEVRESLFDRVKQLAKPRLRASPRRRQA